MFSISNKNGGNSSFCSSFLCASCPDKKRSVADIDKDLTLKYDPSEGCWTEGAPLPGLALRIRERWEDLCEPWVSLRCRQLLEQTRSRVHRLTAWQDSVCYL